MTRRFLFGLAATLSFSTTACRRDAGGPYGAKVAEFIPIIEKAMNRKFKTLPKLEIRTRDQVRDFLLAHVQDSTAQRELAGQTAAFRVLGLIPDTLDLKKLLVPLLTEQIIGYYDPKTKVLYVVDGAPKDYAGITIMHELVHALQDQYVNLDSLENESSDSDRQTAVQAVIEGQATVQQAVVTTGGQGNLVASLPGGWEQIRAMIREAISTQPVFASAPTAIQESLLFPYVSGWDFAIRYSQHHPSRMSFDSLPQSTEQVMHDQAYFGAHPDLPIKVTLPPIAGSFYQNNLGEFGVRLFLYGNLADTLVLRSHGAVTDTNAVRLAARAAAGWGGDQYAVVRTPQGNGIVCVSTWDTAVDAAEYDHALTELIVKRFADTTGKLPPGVLKTTSPGNRRYDAGGRTIVVATREVDRRMVISYTDVPKGANASLVDLSKVVLH